jgi:hypothetical protein
MGPKISNIETPDEDQYLSKHVVGGGETSKQVLERRVASKAFESVT